MAIPLSLAAALIPMSAKAMGKVGLAFLLLAGIGQVTGGLFDINFRLHGPAATVGIPSLCISAVPSTMNMAGRGDITAPPVWAAHLPWIIFALMLGAFALFASALSDAGIQMPAQSEPLQELPAGVSGCAGWANRLLFAACYFFTALAALSVLRLTPPK